MPMPNAVTHMFLKFITTFIGAFILTLLAILWQAIKEKPAVVKVIKMVKKCLRKRA